MLTWQSKSRVIRVRDHRRIWLSAMGVGIALAALSQPSASPVLVYNSSPSAPIGYYRTLPPLPIENGDWVLVKAPETVRKFAEARGYLPSTVPMIKAVAAMEGDRVCALEAAIYIDGKQVATRLRRDHRGRTLPWWSGCYTLGRGDLFVLNARVPSSFDGRYFGIIPQASIRARLVKL